DKVVEPAHDFLDGCKSIPDVDPVEIDVRSLKALEAGFEGLNHALAVVACRVGIVSGHSIAVFGRQNDALPMILDKLAHEPLTRTVGVQVGRIDKISSGFPIGFIDLS